MRFWGKWALLPCSWSLSSILAQFDRYYLIARGPLAGLIGLWAYDKKCIRYTIQARGLAAQEYSYTHTGLFAQLRAWQYQRLERSVFSRRNTRILIEAVSPALKQYVLEKYGAHRDRITIAQHDIPAPIDPALIAQWRTAIRNKLTISPSAYVYCYNGSAKPWQCPHETISYFKKQLRKNPHVLLLILTRDATRFEQLCIQAGITQYRICSVPHARIYEYLAAADAGLLFRKSHILNWVSRPTKMLEYQAVGLKIIHNNTINALVNCKV